MDHRNVPSATRWSRERFSPGNRLPQRLPRRVAILHSLALYALAAIVIGLPLAFPAQHLTWLWLDIGLALATGGLIACTGE